MDKLSINVIATTMLLLSISFPIRGKLEADLSYIPAGGQLTEYDILAGVDVPRRTLAGTQVCSQCPCCSGGKNCKVMQCCHTLVCNLPDRPFGTCSFKPTACNCNSCS